MSHERWWRRCIPPLFAALVLAGFTIGQVQAGYQATADSNKTAFAPPCLGFLDSHPTKMLQAAQAAYAGLGYAVAGYSGAAFTRAHTLNRTVNDWGYYVHSHGDYYWNQPDARRYSGFREDGGDCTQAIVFSKDIAAKRIGRPTNLVVISTCHNGDANTTLPAAFGIEKVKAVGDAWNGPEFYLGYLGTAYDNDEFAFEQRLWDAIGRGRNMGEAFDIAELGWYSHADFAADWWGSYKFTGHAGPYTPPCPACQ